MQRYKYQDLELLLLLLGDKAEKQSGGLRPKKNICANSEHFSKAE